MVHHIKKRYNGAPYQKVCFRGTLTNGKLTGISALDSKGTILKKISVSSIAQLQSQNLLTHMIYMLFKCVLL